ncbi:MAG: hypothetical protein HY852_24830 [Bradyrhizobium sp.]|uniref:hypothetical protein n=1 Tax=Bradyrhizobium sp. TaxID=376 RepID=UPI0025BDD870|nr:hypothetical protein [Bradyrhizobium sp.]MBI5265032.1 hypothetical protein [Bradyrhizobium sp.]
MNFSISDAIRQNSPGQSEGFPVGVPKSYNWYKGWSDEGMPTPPSGFTAVVGWGAVYQQVGAPAYSNADAAVEVANAKTYVRIKDGGQWILVQDQSSHPVVGGHFVPDFTGNAGYPMKVTPLPGGGASFSVPPTGYNDHFWHNARGTYAAGTVDAVYVQMDMRVTDPNLNLIASVGADWWRDANAPYLDDHSNNPGVGSSNWVKLSTEWKTLGFYSVSTAELQNNLPPPLRGVVNTPPIAPHLKKKSFEATSATADEWASFGGNDAFHEIAQTVAGPTNNLFLLARSRPGSAGPTTPIEGLWSDSLIFLTVVFGAMVKIGWNGPRRRRKRESRNHSRQRAPGPQDFQKRSTSGS